MARKGWDSLSPAYRSRLEKNGITKEAYGRGESITAARGHGKTPESPRRFDRERYREYAEKRSVLERRLAERKQQLFGGRPNRAGDRLGYSPERSESNIRDHPPTISQLRWALGAEESELIDALIEDPEAFAFLGYH